MVKSTENDNTMPKNKQNIISTLILIAIAAAIVWFLVANRQTLIPAQNSGIRTDTAGLEKHISYLSDQVSQLQNEVYALRTENAEKVSRKVLSALNKKIDDNSKINMDLLDSKASSTAVLNLVSKVDSLERRVEESSKFSSEGALILTAALMVKESAESGRPFVYEAEVLRLLAADTNMEAPANAMSVYAEKGLPTENALIATFNKIYAAEQAHTEAADEKEASAESNWKEKINAKLSGLISIQYNNGKTLPAEHADEIYTLVNAGDLYHAYTLMQTHPAYQSGAFQNWQQAVIERQNFMTALQRIQSMTLAVMKAESLKALTR